MTPFEAWTGEKPSVGHLREFGCDVWVLDESKNRSKLSLRSNKMKFTGFMDGSKSIQYYDAATRLIKVSRNFAFNENDDLNELEIYTDLPDLVDVEGEDTPSDESTNAEINPTTTEIPTTENPSTNTAATPTMQPV